MIVEFQETVLVCSHLVTFSPFIDYFKLGFVLLAITNTLSVCLYPARVRKSRVSLGFDPSRGTRQTTRVHNAIDLQSQSVSEG